MDPRSEYDRRRVDRQDRLNEARRRSYQISTARGVTFALAVATAGATFWGLPLGALAIAFFVAFVTMVLTHVVVRSRARGWEEAAAYYATACDRLDDRWAGMGDAGQEWIDPAHTYSPDLDLFGEGSMYERLCVARSFQGRERLAMWLLRPAPAVEVTRRHETVRALERSLDSREQLALVGKPTDVPLHVAHIDLWLNQKPLSNATVLRWVAVVFSVLLIAALLGWMFGGMGHRPLVGAGMVAFAFWALVGRGVEKALGGLDRQARELAALGEKLAIFEAESATSSQLEQWRADCLDSGSMPSQHIRSLSRLVERMDWSRNAMFGPLAAMLFWSLQIAVSVEVWRRIHGPHILGWLDALANYEAAQSLARYSFENPDDVFPEMLDEPRWEGEAVGHPLLPKSEVVRNDVALDEDTRMLFVSGSNMSGKSTMLRAVGLNTVLAQAGAPVRASRLALGPWRLGASIRVQDSLQLGESKFRAELVRLRRVLELSNDGERPLLFLLDEIFHGTHSHDRRVGAHAFLLRLLSRGASGMVTTHDLALTDLSDMPGARNVHFEDSVIDGRIAFDYKMREGVVQKSNALALMRAEGLID